MRLRFAPTAAVFLVLARPALAQAPAAVTGVTVTAKRLDRARGRIEPSLGASVTRFSAQNLRDMPQGADTKLDLVLAQAPGVALDSFGQVHVRGDHADLQYRLDGVQLPEGLSGFGQDISARIARSASLITGALPAEYGVLQAGVIDLVLKSGRTNPGGDISVSGGARDEFETAVDDGGSRGAFDWFVSADAVHTRLGIENPTGGFNALRDLSNQQHALVKFGYVPSGDARINLIGGLFDGAFQIPDNPGQPQEFPVAGQVPGSGALDERQTERTSFVILSLQQQLGAVDLLSSVFTRASRLVFSPDAIGDLAYAGLAQHADRGSMATGVQSDASDTISAAHTLRLGFLAQGERSEEAMQSTSLYAANDQLFSVYQSSGKTGWIWGIYGQDEWHLRPNLVLNGGLRFDGVEAYTAQTQLDPRVNLVWQQGPATTWHIGYARLLTPPPFELIAAQNLAEFAQSVVAPQVSADNLPRAESAHYFDVGVSRAFTPGITLGIDGYYKIAHDLIDEGQFGAPIILTPFNYREGYARGLEFTGGYNHGGWSSYANVALSRAMGKDIISSQFNFDADELAHIQNHWIHLDHDQTVTASAGLARSLPVQSTNLRLSADFTFGSGLRAEAPDGVPNGIALPANWAVNLAAVETITPRTELRLSVVNVTDNIYEIRNGTGVGVGAPQFGQRRTILAGVTEKF